MFTAKMKTSTQQPLALKKAKVHTTGPACSVLLHGSACASLEGTEHCMTDLPVHRPVCLLLLQTPSVKEQHPEQPVCSLIR